MLGENDGLKGCAARPGKPAPALDPLALTRRLAVMPFRGGRVPRKRSVMSTGRAVTFLSGRNCDFSNGDRHELSCRRKIEMTPGAQSRNDTPPAADTPSATRHRCHTLGLGGGVKGQSRRLPVRAAQPLRPSPRPSTIEQPCEPAEPLRVVSRDRNRWAARSQRACRGQDQRWPARRPRSPCLAQRYFTFGSATFWHPLFPLRNAVQWK